MKSYKMKSYTGILLMGLVIFTGLSSCSSGNELTLDDDTVNARQLTFNISAATNSSTRSVTANGTGNGNDEENIKTYTLIILDNATKTIERIIERPTSNTELVSSERYKTSTPLTDGDKTIFALANITAANAGITYTEGSTLTDTQINEIKSKSYNLSAGNGFTISASNYIPMSNIVTATVTATTTGIDIPVYRMLAKMEFNFINSASLPAKLNSITLSNITKDNIYLFPSSVNFSGDRTLYTDGAGFPGTMTKGDYTYTMTTNNDVATSGTTTKSFYVNESKGDETTKLIGISVNSTYDGLTAEDNYTLSELAFINRNDYIKVPIDLTGYIFAPTVLYYPPIGGYPDATIKKTDGKYYCTFATGGGTFVINPNFRKAGESAPLSFSSVDIKCSNTSLFSTQPVYDSTDGVIKGELNTTATGTSVITLSVKPTTEITLIRKIYITIE